jgi:hypothetical protein
MPSLTIDGPNFLPLLTLVLLLESESESESDSEEPVSVDSSNLRIAY